MPPQTTDGVGHEEPALVDSVPEEETELLLRSFTFLNFLQPPLQHLPLQALRSRFHHPHELRPQLSATTATSTRTELWRRITTFGHDANKTIINS
ncbi:hypothetical protein H6P81_016104 [Aristolochia fimbriata]|uniref:Uncharacterized protein n=1 Tax=Aristolochia fimbriata TaxID=158543 RepID=A0AAV7E816_ARIFI|nr:hypothetical protein H6P81_016104 [Aristolochia fimbriata]